MKKIGISILLISVVFGLCACGKTDTGKQDSRTGSGGIFQMGSPEEEAWRSEDETQHIVTVSN